MRRVRPVCDQLSAGSVVVCHQSLQWKAFSETMWALCLLGNAEPIGLVVIDTAENPGLVESVHKKRTRRCYAAIGNCVNANKDVHFDSPFAAGVWLVDKAISTLSGHRVQHCPVCGVLIY